MSHINAGVARQVKALLAQGLSHERVAAMMAVSVDDIAEVATAQRVAQNQEQFDQVLRQAREPKGVQFGYDPLSALDAEPRFHK
jgi:hypothetical protein